MSQMYDVDDTACVHVDLSERRRGRATSVAHQSASSTARSLPDARRVRMP